MTGSFLSAARCFWQPEVSSAATQASSNKVFERDRGLGGEDGKADDVAFLLMVPLSPREPPLTTARRGWNEDNRSAGKGNHFRTFIAGLAKIDFGFEAGPIDWANVPT